MFMALLLVGAAPAGASPVSARETEALLATGGLSTNVSLNAADKAVAHGFMIPTDCSVPSDILWVVGTNHRTGSQMNNDLLSSIAQNSRTSPHLGATALSAFRDDLIENRGITISTRAPASGMDCVKALPGGSICLVPHLNIEGHEQFQQLRRVATKKNVKLRLVNWVRDPLKVGRSAYMYHVRAPEDELWLFANNSDHIAAIADACAGNGTSGLAPPTIVCTNMLELGPSVRELSYFRFLKRLDRNAGFLAETWRSLQNGIRQMAQTMQTLENASSAVAVTVDLDQAVGSCETEFRRIFNVLEGEQRGSCVQAGCTIATQQCPKGGQRGVGGCGKKTSIHHTTESKEDAEIAEGLEVFAEGNYWFREHVQPVRVSMGYA